MKQALQRPLVSVMRRQGCILFYAASTLTFIVMFQVWIKSTNSRPQNNTKTELPKITPAVQHIFSETCARGSWGDDGNGSGGAFTLEYTERTRALIELLVYKYDVDVLVDVPCGHMAWMPEALDRIFSSKPNFKYLGLDIVPSVIQSIIKRFEKAKRMHFRIFLILVLVQSHAKAKLLFLAEMLCSMSLELVIKALQSFSRSNIDCLFIVSYHGVDELKNITT